MHIFWHTVVSLINKEIIPVDVIILSLYFSLFVLNVFKHICNFTTNNKYAY
jgi:hypothetical protein